MDDTAIPLPEIRGLIAPADGIDRRGLSRPINDNRMPPALNPWRRPRVEHINIVMKPQDRRQTIGGDEPDRKPKLPPGVAASLLFDWWISTGQHKQEPTA